MKKIGTIMILLISVMFGLYINGCSSHNTDVIKHNNNKLKARDVLEYARSLVTDEEYKEAIKEYKYLIAKFPEAKNDGAWAQYELSYCYYYMGDYDKALVEFKKVEKFYPDQSGPVILAKKMITKIEIEQ